MDKEEQERKQFLEQQLEWCRQQDDLLKEMEMKLHKMKRIAQYAQDHVLTPIEREQLNSQLKQLKVEVHLLERQLHSIVH